MSFRRIGLMALVLVMGACTTQRVAPSSAVIAVAPQLAVERFLQAANARDLHAMGRLFGTSDGSFMDTRRRQDVELQMDAISSILRHDDYRIVREEMVAGRDEPTRRVLVDITVRGRRIGGVPFEVVQDGDGRWLVEKVDLEHVMAGR